MCSGVENCSQIQLLHFWKKTLDGKNVKNLTVILR